MARFIGEKMISVGILDRRPIVRAGLELFLTGLPDLRFAGHTGDPGEVVSLVRTEDVQVLICSLSHAVDILRETREHCSELAVLVLSDVPPDELVVQAIRSGAKGHLQADARRAEFLDAIRAVATGRTHLSASLAEQLIDKRDGPAKAPHETLSEREFQVFMKLAQGNSALEIAKSLALSVKTVATYRSRVLEKMQLTSNSDLTYYAMKNRLMA